MPTDAEALPPIPAAGTVPPTARERTQRRWRTRLARAPRWLWLLLAVVAAALLWLAWALPLNRALAPLPEPTLVLLDRHGEAYARRGALKEAPVDSRRLPRHVVDAVLAIEDRRFFSHAGIDPLGIARALVRNTKAGEIEQGGSTITQQLAKTSFLSSERTLRRKLQEGLIALWIEARLDKHEILSRYLSSIYFGDGVYGLRAAARHYFDAAPEDLDIAEAAMLAGIIKAPSALAPSRHPEDARARAQVVIEAMVAHGALTEAQARAIRPATVRDGRADLPVGTYFADWLSPKAKDAFDAAYGEVPVTTTLDLELQRHAEQVVARELRTHGKGVGATQAALVAMRPNGEVVAMVGGVDYAASSYNRVTQAQRQSGSAFKLFVYHAALRDGATPDTRVDDAPITIGTWSPANHDGRYRGPITLREAFARSSNVAAVRLAQEVGAGNVIESARELGITSDLGRDASLALGSYETSLLELTSAYAAIALGAAPVVAYGVIDHPPGARLRELDPGQRWMLLDLLAAAVEDGTGRAAKLRVPSFGKTGTTQDYRDALFVGMAGDLVVGVWVGNDDNTPMDRVTGGTLPARIWGDFMATAVTRYPAIEPSWRAEQPRRVVRRAEPSARDRPVNARRRAHERNAERRAEMRGKGRGNDKGKGKGKDKRKGRG
ncbi:MAG TPA: PBP1A family penicillin-binding protein [Xanthomonadales bacterium]|nr:PBP1A family penicillin-binding protein [Xanthomonadales bacterium]